MSPRTKKYETDAERQKAYRERKKLGLKDKLKAIFTTGNTTTKPINGSPDSTLISQNKPIGTAIMLRPKENAPSQQPKLTGEDYKRINMKCEYCGAIMGLYEAKEDSRCKFCCQFECKEQALYEKMIAQRLARVKNSEDMDLYKKYLKELREEWKCSKCGRFNKYYVKVCEGCGGLR